MANPSLLELLYEDSLVQEDVLTVDVLRDALALLRPLQLMSLLAVLRFRDGGLIGAQKAPSRSRSVRNE